MSLELNLEKIQEMKLPDYTKVFKKPMTWKKAKYVICMNDYKVGSKKGIVFIPYKKPAIAQKAFKKLKLEKIHLPNKSALCEFNLSKDKTELELVIKKGGLAPDLLQKKANVSYKVHNFNVTVKGASSNEELVGSVAPDQSVKEEKEEGGNNRDVIVAARGAIDLFRNNLVPVLKSGKPDDKTESVLDDVSGKFLIFPRSIWHFRRRSTR